MAFNGTGWDETIPTNNDLANEIDDYMRDIKIAVRSRMAIEHHWPSSQAATASAGFHTFLTLSGQTAAPSLVYGTVSTQLSAIWCSSGSKNVLVTDAAAGDYILFHSGKGVRLAGGVFSDTGTQGDLIIGTTGGVIKVLSGSTDNYVLTTHSNTGDPTWQQVTALIGSTSITTTMLKTTQGEVSSATATVSTLPGGEYGFYPETKSSDGSSAAGRITIGGTSLNGNGYVPSAYGTYIAFIPNGNTLYARQRYVTASGLDYWFFILLDEADNPIAAWHAPDHPCYGHGDDPDAVPNPWIANDLTNRKIVILDMDSCAKLLSLSTKQRSMLTVFEQDFTLDMSEELLYTPRHIGTFDSEKNPIRLAQLPAGMTVRRITPRA